MVGHTATSNSCSPHLTILLQEEKQNVTKVAHLLAPSLTPVEKSQEKPLVRSGWVRGPGWGQVLDCLVPTGSRWLQRERSSFLQEERGVPGNEGGSEAVKAINARTKAQRVSLLSQLPSEGDLRLKDEALGQTHACLLWPTRGTNSRIDWKVPSKLKVL